MASPLFLYVWIIAALGLSCLISRLWRDILHRLHQVVFFPGLLVREIGRAAGCLLTRAPLGKFSLLRDAGPEVQGGAPKLPVIGKPIMFFAPLAGSALLAWAALRFTGLWPSGLSELPLSLKASAGGIGDFLRAIFASALWLTGKIARSGWKSGEAYLLLYLLMNIGVALSPKKGEFRAHALWFAGLMAGVVVMDFFCVALLKWDGIRATVSGPMGYFVSAGLTGLVAAALASACPWAIWSLIKALAGPKDGGAS